MDSKLKNKTSLVIFLMCMVVSTIFFVKQVLKSDFIIKIDIFYLSIFIFLYLLSHVFRLLRLFIIYVEEKISFKKLLEAYIVVNYVNFFTPFKIGEFFRIFEISNLMKSFKKGLTGIWIDRFFDTVVLFLFLLLYNTSYKGMTKLLLICFAIFILFSLFCYLFTSYTTMYINRIMLSRSKTIKGLYILKITDYMEALKKTAEYLIKGKEFILFLISLFVWSVEIYSFHSLSKVFGSNINIRNNFNTLLLNWIKNSGVLNLDVYTLSWITFIFSSIFVIKYSVNRYKEYLKGEK